MPWPSTHLISIMALSGAILLSGCMLEIQGQVSCGDGYVDVSVGEECEPGLPTTWESACELGGYDGSGGGCDARTCRLIASPSLCPICGDGVLHPESEDCDGAVMGVHCPSGVGSVQCTPECTLDFSGCDSCGDGVVDFDAGEECDPAVLTECGEDAPCPEGEACDPGRGVCVDPEDVAPPIFCSGLEMTAVGAIDAEAYESGVIDPRDCSDDCRWGRAACGFCGDGVLDPHYEDLAPTDGYVTLPAEVCDAESFDADAVEAFCGAHCTQAPSSQTYGCRYECAHDCRSLELPAGLPDDVEVGHPDLACCLAEGSLCGGPQQAYPCCYELNPGNDGNTGCFPIYDDDDDQLPLTYACGPG